MEKEIEKKIEEKLEKSLIELGDFYKKDLLKDLPPKDLFFQELETKLLKEARVISKAEKSQFTKPVSNFWEQLLWGNEYFLKISFVSVGLMIIVFGLLIYRTTLSYYYNQNSYQHKEVPIFGSKPPENLKNGEKQKSGQNEFPAEKDFNQKIEDDFLKQINEEEDPEKKHELLQKLIEFYKRTNQTEKIDRLLKTLE